MIHPSHQPEFRTACGAVCLMLLLLLGAALLPAPEASRGLANYLPLHTAIEVTAVCIALMIFAVGWNPEQHAPGSGVRWLAALYLGVALLDLSHALSYIGMPDFVTPNSAGKSINFWLAARTLAALALLGAALIPWSRRSTLPRFVPLTSVLLPVLWLHLIFLFFPHHVPDTFIPGEGLTPFKIGYEYGLIAAYLGAAVLLFRRLRRPRSFHTSGLFAAACIMAMGEVFFTLYANVTDVFALLGHLYKAVAYLFLYRAIFVETIQRPYTQLKASTEQLSATIEALPDLLFELDEKGEYLAVHASETCKLAAPADNLIGRTVAEVMPPETAQACLEALRGARQHGRSHGARITLDTPSGRRTFELSVSLKNLVPGGGARFLVLSRDVSAVVQQERDLAREARLNETLLQLPRRAQGGKIDDLLQFGADSAIALTGSRIACVYLAGADSGRFVAAAWAPTTGADGAGLPAPTALTDECVWRDALQSGQVVVREPGDPALPHGLERQVSIPVDHAGKCSLVLAVANKPEAYATGDCKTLAVLAENIWASINRLRHEESHARQSATIRKLSAVVAQSPFPIVITDLNGNIEYANRAYTDKSGYSLSELRGQNPSLLSSGKTPAETYPLMWAHLLRGEAWQGELVNRRKDGSEYVTAALIYPMRDEDGNVVNYIGHQEDITLRKAAAERIQQLANYDHLTGLPNRVLLGERFRQAIDLARGHHEALTVMWLDLDNFKAINDSLGHSAGDLLLREIAHRLGAQLRQQDTLSRQSGDDFTIVIPGADQDAAAAMAEKLLAALEQPIVLTDHELIIGGSIGIALYPNDADSLETLMVCAESAMYRVKQEGRNGFRFYAPEMQAQSARILLLGNALKQAQARGEFHLVFQPQIALHDGRMSGAEVLLRWRSPQWGEVPPCEFIPLAERNSLIVPIGEWLIRSVATQLRHWHEHGLDGLVLAVNLSAMQFAQPNLADSIARLVQECGLEPRFLELELTEAVALHDPESAGRTMESLKRKGFRLSIDDFGTGYSSMSYLRRFAVDKLKIDQSFIRELDTNSDDQAIVGAIIQMAHSLGMSTIAEGVESDAQRAILQHNGCEAVQGYLYSCPLGAEEFAAFARANRANAA